MGMSYEKTIALSRKIMMAGIITLLAATILIIFLHLYAKYLLMRRERVMRNRRSVSLQSLGSDVVVPVDDQISQDSSLKTGLDAHIIASLPKFPYHIKMNGCDEAVECSICLCTLCGEDMVRALPNCKHFFHLECIDKWLGLHTTCPICRTAAEPRCDDQLGLEQRQAEPGSTSVAVESHSGSGSSSSSMLSSFRKLVSGERSSGRVQNFDDAHSSNDV